MELPHRQRELVESSSWDFSGLRALYVNCTLKPAPAGVPILQKVLHEGGLGLRVTMSYNASYLGVQTTIDILYGVAILRNNHAVVLKTSTKP